MRRIYYPFLFRRAQTFVDRNSSAGIAIRYGSDGSGIKSRWGQDFLHPSATALEPTQPTVQWIPGLYPRGKAAGAWR